MFDETHHFDGNNIAGGYNYVRQQIKNSINTAQDCYKDAKSLHDARFELGEAYHALQDFYSHSNWLEMCLYDREKPNVFRWDLHTAFTESNPDGSAQWFTAPLRNMPPRLKTGYFTNSEIAAAGIDVVERVAQRPLPRAVNRLIPSVAQKLRSKMVEEAVRKHTGLRFASEKQYQERIEGTTSFYRALAYAVEDEKKSLLHWEINKDDRLQLEGGMRTPSGETLHDLAKDLAIKDTQLFWNAHVERLLWRQHKGCANLIIPAFKGNALPDFNMNVDVKQLYTPSRTKPLEGSISLRMANMLPRVVHPLGVEVKDYLERNGATGSAVGNVIEKTLRFKSNAEQKIDLKPLVLVAGQESGSFSLVVTACYECDPTFRPVTRRIDLGGGKLGLVAASATPNPAMKGKPIELKLVYNYAEAARAKVHGEGKVESVDGGYRHTLPAQDLPGDGSGWSKPYQATFTHTVPGKYIWYPHIFSDAGEEITTSVPFEILKEQPKAIHSTALLNKAEGQIGDTFILGVNYEITGAPRGPIVVTENSSVQHIDGLNIPLGETNANLNSIGVTAVKSQKFWKFQPINAGVYEWTCDISAPGFGNSKSTQRFVVYPANRVVIDSESVRPIVTQNATTFALRVAYHIVGLTAQDSLQVSQESALTGPAAGSWPQTLKTATFRDSAQILANDFVCSVPGDYEWTYTIDAGPAGRVVQSLPFKVPTSLLPDKTLRDFELVSATVTPPKAANPTGFRLDVRYRALNVASTEVVRVEENDYVNFATKTETHQSSSGSARSGQVLLKQAGFTSTQAGKHVWNYTLTAPGFRTYYSFVPFEVEEAEQRPRLQARLEFSEISCAPGETKNCNILISGYRSDTADHVEIVYPQIMDGWGTLPGQVQVFPGNESLLPQNMRGAGEFTRVYLAGKGYRARETAPPGLTSIKIIVRQKDAGQVELVLFVRVVKRGESTAGAEKPSGQSGTASSGQAGQGGSAGPEKTGSTGAGQGGGDGSVAQDGANKVIYHFKRATISTTAVYGITSTGYSPLSDSGPKLTEFTSNSVSIPVAWDESKQARAGTAQQSASGTVTFTFPEKLILNSYQSDPTSYTGTASIHCKASAAFTRGGPTSAFNSSPVGLFVGDSVAQGVTTSAELQDSRRSYTNGGAGFNLSWDASPMVIERAQFGEGEPSHQPRLLLRNLGQTIVGIGGDDSGFTARVLAPYEIEYVAEPGTKTSAEEADDTVKSGQIIARLEKSKIILEAGKLPGVSNNILVESWKRDTAEPIEVSYPGLGPENLLPNSIRSVYAGGTQLPDALARLQTDGGFYRWPQSYEALKGANPGTYRIPITVKQKGAGAVYLELEVQIVPSTNTKFGDSTAMFNKGARPQVPPVTTLRTARNPVTPITPVARPPVTQTPVTQAPITQAPAAQVPATPTTEAQTPVAHMPVPPRIPTPPVVTAATLNLTGRWYGGSGWVTVVHSGNTVVLSTEGNEYATEWRGVITGNAITGTWSCPRINQKGTFTFAYNPNYNQLGMERISGTYYIEDKWGKDPRDFYQDRKIVRGAASSYPSAVSLNGEWKSDSGVTDFVIYVQTNSVQGSYKSGSAANTGYINAGGYYSGSGRLWFRYWQPYNQQEGIATFDLLDGGKRLRGAYRQGSRTAIGSDGKPLYNGASGSWNLWR